jgi:hypothetical protein
MVQRLYPMTCGIPVRASSNVGCNDSGRALGWRYAGLPPARYTLRSVPFLNEAARYGLARKLYARVQ